MKQMLTLQELAEEVQRQHATKLDVVHDTRKMSLSSNGTSVIAIDDVMDDGGVGEFEVGEIAHGQIAARLGIPKKYYDRMRTDYPELLDRNVNGWFAQQPERRMVRTLDGKARAFLSDRYRRIDNYDIANVVLPIISELDGNVVSCGLTEQRMYVKVEFPAIEAPVPGSKQVGDVLRSGLVFSNSEVGKGMFSIEPYTVQLICLNGMVRSEWGLNQRHVGSAIEDSEESLVMFADDTLAAEDEAFKLKIRDICRLAVDEERFNAAVATLGELTQIKIEGDPIGVIEKLENKFDLTEHERGNVLTHLIEGADLSAWGVVSAITRASQDIEDYDRAHEFEEIGGRLAEMPRNEVAALLTV